MLRTLYLEEEEKKDNKNNFIMMKKVEIVKRDDGKMYDFTLYIMGREELLLKDNELLELYDDITSIILDDESLWKR